MNSIFHSEQTKSNLKIPVFSSRSFANFSVPGLVTISTSFPCFGLPQWMYVLGTGLLQRSFFGCRVVTIDFLQLPLAAFSSLPSSLT